jgi:hypothetical protein
VPVAAVEIEEVLGEHLHVGSVVFVAGDGRVNFERQCLGLRQVGFELETDGLTSGEVDDMVFVAELVDGEQVHWFASNVGDDGDVHHGDLRTTVGVGDHPHR